MAAISALATGGWTAGNFSGGVLPGPADDVTIPAGVTITSTVNPTVCRSLTITGASASLAAFVAGAAGLALQTSRGVTLTNQYASISVGTGFSLAHQHIERVEFDSTGVYQTQGLQLNPNPTP